MKKTIIALLLVACVCVPAFARSYVQPFPSFGISGNVGFDKDGFTFEGIGVYADLVVLFDSPVVPEARIEFQYSFTDAKQTGLYVDLLASYEIIGGIGAGADFHIVDGKIVTNFSAVLHGGYPVADAYFESFGFIFNPELSARYTFVNNSDVPTFSAGLGLRSILMLGN